MTNICVINIIATRKVRPPRLFSKLDLSLDVIEFYAFCVLLKVYNIEFPAKDSLYDLLLTKLLYQLTKNVN